MKDAVNVSSETILDQEKKETDIITLRGLLSGDHVFRIPDYQRGYAWREEFEILWKDILRLYRADVENRKHYTGMLALEEFARLQEEIEGIFDKRAFYVVDGQQRITSLFIIVKYLIDYIAEEDDSFSKADYQSLLKTKDNIDKFGYSIQRRDGMKDYFEKRVLQDDPQVKHSNQYCDNIHFACKFIKNQLKKFDGETTKKLLALVLDKIVFNIYFITDSFDVRVTFETINNRGKKLSKLELLKNRLMYLSTFLPRTYSGQLKGKVNNTWKAIYENLSFGDFQISDDEYLKAHWIVYKRLNKNKGDAFIKDILNNEFSVDAGEFYKLISQQKNDEAYMYLYGYVESLEKYSEYWAYVNRQQVQLEISEKERSWIKRFSRLTNNLYVRSALMVVLAETELGDKEEFYSLLEQFVFVNKLLAQDKNDLSFIVTTARDLMKASPEKKVQIFKSMKEQIRNHELKVSLNRIQSALRAFKSHIESRGNYYYEWSGLHYFLYEYNESLHPMSAASIEWYDLSKVSVEHVFPQTPDKEYWKIAFGTYIDTDQQGKITNALGNLLLLSSGSENSSLKNYSYPIKREISGGLQKFSYMAGSPSARAVAQSKYWTPKQVYARTKRMFDFMREHWFSEVEGLPKADWDVLVETLGLYNFTYTPLSDAEQAELEKQLDAVDTSQERRSAEQTVKSKATDYERKTVLSYFDPDELSLYYNNHKPAYKPHYFSFVLQRDENGDLELFRCGVEENGKKVEFRYSYKTNDFCVYKLGGFYYAEDEITNPKWMLFIRSFFRYVRKQYGQKPNWKQEWVE